MRRRLVTVLSCVIAMASCGGGGGNSPTDPNDGEFSGVGSGARPITLVDETWTITEFGIGYQLGYSDGFTSPGRMTATVTYEPATALVRVAFARKEGDLGGCTIPLPSHCTSLGGVETSDGRAVLVVEPVPPLPVPAVLFEPNAAAYDLVVDADPTVQAHVLVRFEPDPNAPRPPEIDGTWSLDATLNGAGCGSPAFSGPFRIFVEQTGVIVEGSIHEADGILTGRAEVDGSFEMSGDVTPGGGGVTTLATLTGQVRGTSMSGSFSRRWPDGCVSSGTFSGSRR